MCLIKGRISWWKESWYLLSLFFFFIIGDCTEHCRTIFQRLYRFDISSFLLYSCSTTSWEPQLPADTWWIFVCTIIYSDILNCPTIQLNLDTSDILHHVTACVWWHLFIALVVMLVCYKLHVSLSCFRFFL